MGASPVSFDREVAGLFDFGGASAEDQCPHSGAVQLDRGVRLAVWGGMDLPCNDSTRTVSSSTRTSYSPFAWRGYGAPPRRSEVSGTRVGISAGSAGSLSRSAPQRPSSRSTGPSA